MIYAESVTSIERGSPTAHNIHNGLVRGLVSRSAVAPSAPKSVLRSHVSPTQKPWQAFPDGISHAQAAVALALNPLRLLHREHGVRHQLVVAEHCIVVCHALDCTEGAQA